MGIPRTPLKQAPLERSRKKNDSFCHSIESHMEEVQAAEDLEATLKAKKRQRDRAASMSRWTYIISRLVMSSFSASKVENKTELSKKDGKLLASTERETFLFVANQKGDRSSYILRPYTISAYFISSEWSESTFIPSDIPQLAILQKFCG